MKSTIICLALALGMSSFVAAQSKKDLIAAMDQLKKELSTLKDELSESRKSDRINLTKVQSMETQVKDLKETNASLLANMGSFTQLSEQKSKNLERSLQTIKNKDRQLNTINDALTKGDSSKLATLTVFKNGLGSSVDSEVKLNIQKGAVYLTMANSFLFGDSKSIKISTTAKSLLGKIGNVLNAKPDLTIVVEGNSNELSFGGSAQDNWDLSSLQASAVARTLQTEFAVAPKRIEVLGKSEYGSSSIETSTRIMVSPKYDAFYAMVKESMKNSAK